MLGALTALILAIIIVFFVRKKPTEKYAPPYKPYESQEHKAKKGKHRR